MAELIATSLSIADLSARGPGRDTPKYLLYTINGPTPRSEFRGQTPRSPLSPPIRGRVGHTIDRSISNK